MRSLAEREQPLDVLRSTRFVAGILGDHIVEADQLVIDLQVVVERRRTGSGVDDRQHVADAQTACCGSSGMPQMMSLWSGRGMRLFYSNALAMCRPTANMPKMKALRKVSADSRRRACWPSHTPTMVGAMAPTLLARLVR